VWWDKHLLGGASFRQQIDTALDQSQVVVVIWTKNSIESQWVHAEAEHALRDKKLIGIRTLRTPFQDIPKPFSMQYVPNWNDFTKLDRSIRDKTIEVFPAFTTATPQERATARRPNAIRSFDEAAYRLTIEGAESIVDFEEYIRRFPDGPYVHYAKHRVSAYKTHGTETNSDKDSVARYLNKRDDAIRVIRELADGNARIIMLLFGTMIHGGLFWCYAAVKPTQFEEFTKAEQAGRLDLYNFDDLGEIIVSAEGDYPPHEVTETVAEMYATNAAEFFRPIVPLDEIVIRAMAHTKELDRENGTNTKDEK
jgi:hypothetical protein